MKKRTQPIFLPALIIFFLIVGSISVGAMEMSAGQTVYVPVYSHIYSGNRERPFNLAVTLSIRNTDISGNITILSVDYYDSDGRLLKRYIEKDHVLNSLASIRYVVKESDTSGGSGANFIVKWQSNTEINPPLIESVMIGTQSQQGISFTSRGQVISD